MYSPLLTEPNQNVSVAGEYSMATMLSSMIELPECIRSFNFHSVSILYTPAQFVAIHQLPFLSFSIPFAVMLFPVLFPDDGKGMYLMPVSIVPIW